MRGKRLIGRGARAAVLLFCIGSLAGCDIDWFDVFGSNDHDHRLDTTVPVAETNIPGLAVAESNAGFDDTFNTLFDAVSGQREHVRQIDFQANAGIDNTAPIGTGAIPTTTGANTDITTHDNDTLRPARLIIFDDPARITPILQADARAALDLPPRLLVYQDGDGNVGVAYNNRDYLAARFKLAAAGEALDALADNLQTLAQEAAGNGLARQGAVHAIGQGEGIVAVRSDNDFATTVDRLAAAIHARADLRLIDRIDNQAAANSVGLSLNPSELVLFSDRDATTPLIAAGQTAAIDLPQKLLITEDDDGDVHVYYNKPSYLADRHAVSGAADAIDQLDGLLSDLTATATGS